MKPCCRPVFVVQTAIYAKIFLKYAVCDKHNPCLQKIWRLVGVAHLHILLEDAVGEDNEASTLMKRAMCGVAHGPSGCEISLVGEKHKANFLKCSMCDKHDALIFFPGRVRDPHNCIKILRETVVPPPYCIKFLQRRLTGPPYPCLVL